MTVYDLDAVGSFARAVAAYCGATRASVTSWIRTPHRNSMVGGARYSRHKDGLGVDVVYDLIIPLSRAETVAGELGLELIREYDHDHLQAPRKKG